MLRSKLLPLLLTSAVFLNATALQADPVRVRYLEGVTLGFLVLRNTAGQTLAYGEFSQTANADGMVTHDLHFRFKDGSSFQEVTKFTQHGEFRLVSDHVVQKGPVFKQESEMWIDAATGDVKIRSVEKGKEKVSSKHMDLPADVANGLLFTLVKNLDPATATSLSMVAGSAGTPRLVTLNISSAQGKTIRVGSIKYQALNFLVKIKINGIAGVVAPIIGRQPADINIWVVKSGAPTFVEFEGQLSADTPVWRIELASPSLDQMK
jgi:hypothetical protein